MAARTSERPKRSKRDDTRKRLFAAAVRLFAKHGYEGTTIDAIVRAAGVAKGTFFIHFATKDAVVTELVRHQIRVARLAREETLAARGSPVEALRATVLSLGRQAAANRELTRAVMTANMMSPALGGFAESVFGGIIADMKADVRAAQRTGLFDSKVDADQIALTLITLYFGTELYFATAPNTKPLMKLLVPMLETNIEGFRPVERVGRRKAGSR